MEKSSKNTPPWEKKSPKKGKPAKLTDAEKALAKARADEAGRRYPNLVDNMWVLKRRGKTS